MGLPERGKNRTSPRKALMCRLAPSQNKGLSDYQRRASRLWTGPSTAPEAEGPACDSQSQKARLNLSPRDRRPPPNCEQAPSC